MNGVSPQFIDLGAEADYRQSAIGNRQSAILRCPQRSFAPSNSSLPPQLPAECRWAIRRWGLSPSRHLLVVSVARQRMGLWERQSGNSRLGQVPAYVLRKEMVVSTSGYGIGQEINSNCTPLGLHCVARKVGGGHPIGTVFKSRLPVGFTWQGRPDGTIVHRILWLAGLEPGFNQGGQVDTFSRYIYIHGFGDETTLGKPNSHGCIHVSAADLMPLYEQVPVGTLVWISAR